jgi:hypothetical protein
MNPNTNNGGITYIPTISTGALFINGKRFRDVISELVATDQFEQSEITELKQLVQYLNTSGLTSEWIVDNQNVNQSLKALVTALETKLAQIDTTALTQTSILNNDNRNSVLKTLITALETKLAQIDTTALTQPSVLNNDNRNSVLKTRIDGNDGSLSTLNGKTQYIAATVGDNNANPKTLSEHQILIANAAHKKRILLSTFTTAPGFFNINLTGDDSLGNPEQAGEDTWAANNRIDITNTYGNIEMTCRKAHIQGKVEIGDFGEATTDRRPINIGGSMARINIGSEKDPKVGTGPGDPDTNDTTIINIGKLTALKNTETNLRGNIYTSDARFESLSKSQALSLSALLGIITSTGLPLYINIISALGLSSYVHSDLWGLAGTVVKNGDLATTNDIKVKSYSLYNTDVNFVDLFPVENTFIASGSSSKTLLLGSIKEQVFKNGSDITLRHNNILATNVEWALSEANDNVNALCIKGNDGILLHQGASSVGTSMKILNSKSGKIELLIGNAGTQASCLTGVQVDWNSGQPQTIIGSKVALQNAQQNNSKLLVQQTDSAGQVGIEVVKSNQASAPLFRTTISDNNVDTHSVSLKAGYAGTTTNALYLSEGGQLMFNGSAVGSGTSSGGAGGIIYLLSGPTSDITYTAANLFLITYEMTATYVSRATKRIRFGTYTAGQTYQLFNHRGAIPRASSNPILKGSYELNPYITYNGSGGGNANWYADAYFYADSLGTLSPFEDFLINKFYPLALQGGTSFQYVGSVGTTAFIPTNNNAFVLNIRQVRFPFVQIFGSSLNFRCEIVDTDNSLVLYTFPILVLTSQSGGTITSQVDMTFDAGSVIKVDQGFIWIGTRFRFRLTLVSGSSGAFFSQQTAFNIANMAFNIPHFTGVNFTTPISMNGANRAILTNSSTQVLSSLTLPITDYDISIFSNPQFDLRFFFAQPSGGTNNHYVDFHFWDGALSHIHTSINTAAAQVPGLALVMNSGNSASTTLNMNSNGITGIPFGSLVGSDTIAWNVRNIAAGTGISATNSGNGTITIATTSNITSIGLRYGGPLTALVTFNMAQSYSLATHRITGRAQLFVTNLFDFPVIRISGAGDNASAANTNEQSFTTHTYYQSPATNQENPTNQATNHNWLDRSCCFSNINLPNACEVLLEFTINLIRDPQGAVGGNNSVIRGRATWISKVVDTLPAFKMYGFFERHTAATTFSSLELGTFGGFQQAITQANLQVEIIPLPTF